MTLLPAVLSSSSRGGVGHVQRDVGALIPPETDAPSSRSMGVGAVFGPRHAFCRTSSPSCARGARTALTNCSQLFRHALTKTARALAQAAHAPFRGESSKRSSPPVSARPPSAARWSHLTGSGGRWAKAPSSGSLIEDFRGRGTTVAGWHAIPQSPLPAGALLGRPPPYGKPVRTTTDLYSRSLAAALGPGSLPKTCRFMVLLVRGVLASTASIPWRRCAFPEIQPSLPGPDAVVFAVATGRRATSAVGKGGICSKWPYLVVVGTGRTWPAARSDRAHVRRSWSLTTRSGTCRAPPPLRFADRPGSGPTLLQADRRVSARAAATGRARWPARRPASAW